MAIDLGKYCNKAKGAACEGRGGSDPCQKNGGFIRRNIAITLSGDPKQPCYLFQELSEC